MRYLFTLLLSLVISSPLFALVQCDPAMCTAFDASLNPPATSHFIINTSGYKLVNAQVPAGYSWGGFLDTGFNTTQLCCSDADQFFSVVSTDPSKHQQCTIDSGHNPVSNQIYATQRNDLSSNNNMDCGVTKIQQTENTYTYEIIIPPQN